jgi:type I site-specific restriction endonuclease
MSLHLVTIPQGWLRVTKKSLSETDICDKIITPAVQQAGWDLHEQIFREYTLRPGRVVVRGKSSSRDPKSILRADYVLCHKANIPLAVIEAKDNNHALGAGMAQAINYAALLDVPFSFSSNGDGFVFRDQTMASGVLERRLGQPSHANCRISPARGHATIRSTRSTARKGFGPLDSQGRIDRWTVIAGGMGDV